MAGAERLEPAEVKEISDRLIDNVSVIDEYLLENRELSDENRKIIEGWKRSVRGRFVIERHLKGGSIMISMEDETVYQVGGIITSIEEMFRYAPMPLVVEATLMPFREVIITDGLIIPYNLYIGGNMKRMFKDVYMSSKKSRNIKKVL